MKRLLSLLTAQKLRLGVVAVPCLLAAFYLFALAADRYVSESIVTVRQNGAEGAVGFNLTSLLGVSVPASLDDEKMLEAYILSIDILRKLDQDLGLQESFNSPGADFIFRLGSGASQEQFLHYYRSRVEVVVEEDSGLLRIRAQGFSPEAAAALNSGILALSERFINEVSQRLAREQMAFAESELRKARSGVDKARLAVLGFQKAHDILDPLAQAEASSGLTAQLQASREPGGGTQGTAGVSRRGLLPGRGPARADRRHAGAARVRGPPRGQGPQGFQPQRPGRRIPGVGGGT